jgi:hypothetical protein
LRGRGSECIITTRMKPTEPRGVKAARLRQRKFDRLRGIRLPPDALPGSLSLSHRRCGKPACHCAREKEGHPVWTLTFMVDGKKRVERIPPEWVDEVRRRVDGGREFKQAWTEILVANAELLVLGRQQAR